MATEFTILGRNLTAIYDSILTKGTMPKAEAREPLRGDLEYVQQQAAALEQLVSQVDSLKERLGTATEEVERLTPLATKSEEVAKELAEAKGVLQAAQEEIRRLNEEVITGKDTEIQTLTGRVEELTREDLGVRNNALSEQLKLAKEESEQRREEIEKLGREHEKANKLKDEALAEAITAKDKEHGKVVEARDATIAERNATIGAENADKAARTGLAGRVQTLKEESAALQATLGEQPAEGVEGSGLRRQLWEQAQRIQELETQNSQLTTLTGTLYRGFVGTWSWITSVPSMPKWALGWALTQLGNVSALIFGKRNP